MNILIFDDDIAFIDTMKKSIRIINLKRNGIFPEPTYVYSVEEAIAYTDANKENPSLYFLDIMADNVKVGFAIAEHIKEVNKNNIIIYVTDFQEHILTNIMPYKLFARAFILKQSDNFLSELECVLLKMRDTFIGNYLIVNWYGKITRVRLEDVYYFKKKIYTNHVVVIHKDGSDTIKDNLNSLIKKLSSYFCYTAKDFIVNTKMITSIDKEEKTIILKDGEQCPYSRSHIKELLTIWKQ